MYWVQIDGPLEIDVQERPALNDAFIRVLTNESQRPEHRRMPQETPDADATSTAVLQQPLHDSEEVSFRQIHPSFVFDGQPFSQPFVPTDKDNNKLSVGRSAVTDAARAFALYVNDGNSSVAVYGLVVGEFGQENLRCVPEPLEKTDARSANPAHAYADYSPFGTNQQNNKAKRLKQKAIARGRLYP